MTWNYPRDWKRSTESLEFILLFAHPMNQHQDLIPYYFYAPGGKDGLALLLPELLLLVAKEK